MSVSTLTPLEVALDHTVSSITNLLWVYFNGPILEGLEVDHTDEVGTHNHPSNLQVIPHSENIRLGYERRGEWRYGMRLPRNDTEKVTEMKALKAQGWSYRAIGRKYGVWGTTVRYLVNDAPSSRRVTSGGRRHG